jgi:hypothetical protein
LKGNATPAVEYAIIQWPNNDPVAIDILLVSLVGISVGFAQARVAGGFLRYVHLCGSNAGPVDNQRINQARHWVFGLCSLPVLLGATDYD